MLPKSAGAAFNAAFSILLSGKGSGSLTTSTEPTGNTPAGADTVTLPALFAWVCSKGANSSSVISRVRASPFSDMETVKGTEREGVYPSAQADHV